MRGGFRERLLTREAANVFAPGQDVALHGPFDVFFCSAGHKIQLGIKGVELEEVAMGFAGRGTGPAITDFPKVIAALARTVSRLLVLREILWERAQLRGQVKDHPMHPGSHRSVGIVSDQNETLSGGRRDVPFERRGNIRTFASELFRNISTGGEIGTLQFQRRGSTSRKPWRAPCKL